MKQRSICAGIGRMQAWEELAYAKTALRRFLAAKIVKYGVKGVAPFTLFWFRAIISEEIS